MSGWRKQGTAIVRFILYFKSRIFVIFRLKSGGEVSELQNYYYSTLPGDTHVSLSSSRNKNLLLTGSSRTFCDFLSGSQPWIQGRHGLQVPHLQRVVYEQCPIHETSEPSCWHRQADGHRLHRHLPGLDTNSNLFLIPLCEKSLICLEGKSMTPHQGNSILFRSSQQLPHLRLGPSKGFLSWHGALLGPSTRLVCCFRNYRGTRTPSGVPR